MDKQKMLTKIYDKIADKTLSFGVKVNIKYRTDQEGGYMIGTYIPSQKKIEGAICTDIGNKFNGFWYPKKSDCEIIGHPIVLGDVLDWIRKNITPALQHYFGPYTASQEEFRVFAYWKELRQPIDQQSDECIEYVYNLITTPGNQY